MTDTFRASGDAVYGTVLELSFLYVVVVPTVCLTGLVLQLPFFAVFTFCYIDEPIRLVLMQRHLYSGKWIKPVTPEGMAAVPAFIAKRSRKKA